MGTVPIILERNYMAYKVKITNIWTAHDKAWNAIENSANMTWKQIDKAYHDKYHATLIRKHNNFGNAYEFVEFENEGVCILFMLEWS